MIREIEHITVNTGAARLSARAEVDDTAVDRVRAGLASGGSVGAGWTVRLAPSPEGVHLYDLAHDGHRVVTCLLCAERGLSARAWVNIAGAAPPGVRLHQPDTAPWLATIIAAEGPLAEDPILFADIFQEAGDLERVVAWALLD